MPSDWSFVEVDDAFMKMYENSVWYGLNDPGTSLMKAPNMWRGDEYVPDFITDAIERALDGAIWDDFKGIPESAVLRLRQEFKENMTQPQGWSVGSLVSDLVDEFAGIDEDQASVIVRNESAAILNSTREEVYKEREDADEYEYYWSGPSDHRTTECCKFIKSEIESYGGSVSLQMLKDILDTAATRFKEQGGTPERVKDFVPHYQCRHTFVRKVQL